MSTYSFVDVTATIVGPTGVFSLGYGEATAEEGIVIARAGDKNTMTIGSDGEGMHSLHADKSGQVTLRYLKTAPVNAKLMAMYDAQSLSSALWGKNLIEVSQTAAGDVITARSCAFKKAPDLRYAKDGDIVEWIFDSIKIDSLLGQY
ncbi:putative bacteriophage protein [Burkholderia sp. AU4i]|uniref:phage structural protein n=1 Tax=Burkholderia sp. AU4i TaxID=1335308 RepID=UPI0003989C0A|nr:phage protein [Burkholderia sp. AU4i]ERJ35937.1 putative bacteriophage protein [Burkholderia sp. AU4i]